MGSLASALTYSFLQHWEPQPPGTLRACPDLYRDCFAFYDSFTLLLGTYQNGNNVAVFSEFRAYSMIFRRIRKIAKSHY